MRFNLLLVATAACHAPDDPSILPVDQAPPTTLSLELSSAAVAPGDQFTLTISGAPSSRPTYLALTSGGMVPGAFCPPILGGECLDLGGSVRILFSATADANGEITRTISVPPGVALGTFHFQAASPFGRRSPAELSVAQSLVISDCDIWYADFDGDGYGDDTDTLIDCVQPPGFVALGGDCDDASDAIHPDALEIYNTVDDNCDGQIDEGLDGIAPRWVSFNGESGVVINASHGVRSVVRDGAGRYTIFWEDAFPSVDYVITGSCNMLGTNGVRFGLEGNNQLGDVFEGVTAGQVSIGCRDYLNDNRDSDLVHVMAVQHEAGFVVFDGDGGTPIVRASRNVSAVSKVGAGRWDVQWTTPFADRNYMVMGACNMLGTNGAKFGLEGNNITDSANEYLFEDVVRVGCRDETNSGADSDLVMLTALASDGGFNPPAAWVTFNGSSGVVVNGSHNVDSVARNGAGKYTINWTDHFANTNYVVTGNCNMLGTGGAKFGLLGNNLPGDVDEAVFTDRVEIGCRDSDNFGADGDLVHVIAYAAE